MNRKWGALALAAAVAAMLMVAGGCGNKQKAVKNDTGTETVQPGGETPEGEPKPGEEAIKDPVTGEVVDITKPVTIPEPGTKGWQKEEKLTPQALAAKMDEAMRNLDRGYAIVKLAYDYEGAQLNGQADLRFEKKGKYRVEYYLPETETTRYSVVANGTKRALLADEGWKSLGNVGEARGGQTIDSKKLTEKWATDFMGEMLSYYRDGTDAWKPIINAWTSNPNAFTVSMEEGTRKLQESNGNYVDRGFYRLVIKSKKNSDKMEVIVDGKHFVPLTIKSVLNNNEDQLFWTAQWGFTGGEHDQKHFQIPSGI